MPASQADLPPYPGAATETARPGYKSERAGQAGCYCQSAAGAVTVSNSRYRRAVVSGRWPGSVSTGSVHRSGRPVAAFRPHHPPHGPEVPLAAGRSESFPLAFRPVPFPPPGFPREYRPLRSVPSPWTVPSSSHRRRFHSARCAAGWRRSPDRATVQHVATGPSILISRLRVGRQAGRGRGHGVINPNGNQPKRPWLAQTPRNESSTLLMRLRAIQTVGCSLASGPHPRKCASCRWAKNGA